ncbi:MAG: MFS transporter, partial [Planctomycetota bacterium]
FVAILVVRFLFGAGEAGAFPGMSRAVFSWIPMSERGLVQGINFSGSRLGAALALPLIAVLIDGLGWRGSFVVLMLVGFVWAVAWYVLFRDDPAEVESMSDAERQLILDGRQQSSGGDGDPGLTAAAIGRSSTVGLLCVQYFASNFTFFIALSWLFPLLKERFALSGLEASLYASAPFVAGAIGSWVAGWLIDVIYRAGHWPASRRVPAVAGFAFATVGLLGTAYSETAFATAAWFSLAIFGADMTLAPSWTTCVDIGKKNAGVVSGTMNMAGNIGSFVTSLAFPFLKGLTVDSDPSNKAFFFVAAALNAIAVAVWFLIDPRKPIVAGKEGVVVADAGQADG